MIPRTQVKVFTDNLYQLLIAKLSCPKGIYHDRCGMRYADGIGELDLTFLCQSCRHHIFCHVPSRICWRTIHLCAVFAGKLRRRGAPYRHRCPQSASARSVRCRRAVANNKPAGWVYEKIWCSHQSHLPGSQRQTHAFNILMDLLLEISGLCCESTTASRRKELHFHRILPSPESYRPDADMAACRFCAPLSACVTACGPAR